MSVREFYPFDGDGDGLEFGEFWNNRAVIQATVEALSLALHPCECYCLQLNVEERPDVDSWFGPYAGTGVPTCRVDLSEVHLPYYRLLVQREGGEGWPVLGQWVPDATRSVHPVELANSVWHGLIRAKSVNNLYCGFLKAVRRNGDPVPDDHVRIAYRSIRAWLRDVVEEMRRCEPQYQRRLSRTHQLIESDMRAGRRAAALQRLATLLTSHVVGPSFNRIVFLTPSPGQGQTLQVEYAHGGDGTQSWSDAVQTPLAQQVHSFEELQDLAGHGPPVDDPLYRDLVEPTPAELAVKTSRSLLAELWKAGGDLAKLREEMAVAQPLSVKSDPNGTVRVQKELTIGGKFDRTDSWFEELRQAGRGEALRSSQNGRYYVLGWRGKKSLLGLVVLDLANSPWCEVLEHAVPRLKCADSILRQFASHFEP